MKAITVLVVPPGKEMNSYLKIIVPTLAKLQELVGGDIEERQTDFGMMIMNTDGYRLGLALNPKAASLTGFGIVGTVVMAGDVDKRGNLTDYRGPKSL